MPFGELPKLFDRDFAIGYILPVAAFVAISFGLIQGFGLPWSSLPFITQGQELVNTTVMLLLSWLLAVLLLSINRIVYTLLEGYGELNPAHLFAWKERRRFMKIQARLDALWTDYDASKSEDERQTILLKEITPLAQREAEEFPYPHNLGLLLPTRFGNTMRAFETYPEQIYGIDAINGWNRLLAVLPAEYRKLVDAAKAQSDFWVNLWMVSLLSMIEYLVLLVITTNSAESKMLWFPLPFLVLAFVAARGARSAAAEWGDTYGEGGI